MNTTVGLQRLPALDDPWRRAPWLAPLAVATWILLLFVFSLLLRQTAAPPAELKPLEARIIEVPVGGLQGAGAKPATAPSRVAARPAVMRKPAAIVHPKKLEESPVPSSPEGTLKGKAEESTSPSSPAAEGEEGSTGSGPAGSAGGIGSDSVGARAVYAPEPRIPDDLREEVFQAEAVARFNVTYDGTVKVSLVKATTNPRLNQILLDTLLQWRFFPAVKDGIAIDSEFEVRIPIAVR